MAIINTNIVELADSGVELAQTVIIGHTFFGKMDEGNAKIEMQIAFYANVEKWKESVRNSLNVKGFIESKRRFTFNYLADTEEPIFYFFDIKLKEHLIKAFPDWDASKLVITTEPVK